MLDSAARFGHSVSVPRPRWRVQAHWRVGESERSYNPFYVRSQRQARRAARELSESLSHFVDLVITIDPVDRAIADAAKAERKHALANAPRPLLHLFNGSHDAALCGVACDELNALATPDMHELSSSEKCGRCAALASSGNQQRDDDG